MNPPPAETTDAGREESVAEIAEARAEPTACTLPEEGMTPVKSCNDCLQEKCCAPDEEAGFRCARDAK